MKISGKVRYSDTDQMGVAHHSNYIKWLEDARIAYFEHKKVYLQEIEDIGFMVPVVDVSISYKAPLRFANNFEIEVALEKITCATFTFSYKITLAGNTCAVATTTHCIIDAAFKPMSKRKWPQPLMRLIEN